jgi:hypothetical protein
LSACRAAFAAHRLRGGVFAVINVGRFLDLAGQDLHHMDRIADNIARSFGSPLCHARSAALR